MLDNLSQVEHIKML